MYLLCRYYFGYFFGLVEAFDLIRQLADLAMRKLMDTGDADNASKHALGNDLHLLNKVPFHTVILSNRTLKKWALSSFAFQHC